MTAPDSLRAQLWASVLQRAERIEVDGRPCLIVPVDTCELVTAMLAECDALVQRAAFRVITGGHDAR